MKLHAIITLGLIVISAASCKKQTEEPAKEVGFFDKIYLTGNTDVTLVQGSSNTVISTTLDDGNYSSTSDSTLHIGGNGTITIAVVDLKQIVMVNGGLLLNSGTVTLPNLYVNLTHASANVTNFHVTGTFEGHFMNTGNYQFSGSAGYARVSPVNAAKFNSPDFVCDSLRYFGGLCNVDSKVHVTQVLRASLGTGNLYYNGNPPIIDSSYSGFGRIYPL